MAKGRKEFKDEQLFARLIGAAVLLALAVIVLPFVLDGSGSQREYEYAETLPVEPQRPVVEKSFSSRQPTVSSAGSTTLGRPPSRESIDVSVPETTSLAGLEESSIESSRTIASTEELTDAVATAASGTTATLTQAQPLAGSLQTVPLQPGWSIQVASFVRDANAVKLINKLQVQNLPTYANRVEGKKRPVIRVLVGPFSNQIDALALQNRIDSDYRVESLMVRRK